MTAELLKLLAAARKVEMTKEQTEEQRISFAYGNTHFENQRITRDTVKEAARLLEGTDNAENGHTTG